MSSRPRRWPASADTMGPGRGPREGGGGRRKSVVGGMAAWRGKLREKIRAKTYTNKKNKQKNIKIKYIN